MTKLSYNEALEKLVKIADSLDKKQDELSPEMANIITAIANKHSNDSVFDEVDNNWDDLFAMLDDMKIHAFNNGGAIIQEDNPLQLKFGYRCTNTNKTWSIRIHNIKNSLNKDEDTGNTERADIFRKAIQTVDGKENLLKIINGK